MKIKLSISVLLLFFTLISSGQTIQKHESAFGDTLCVQPINCIINTSFKLIALSIPISKKSCKKLNTAFEVYNETLELQANQNYQSKLELKSSGRAFGFFMSF